MPYIIRDKVHTSHALLDEIVYNCKLILQSIIIKDETLANANETKNSLENSDVLLSINNGTMSLDSFPLTTDYLEAFGYDEFTAYEYANDHDLIPEQDRANLLKFCCNSFVKGYPENPEDDNYIIPPYEEENNYYRMLNGEPAYGTTDYDIYIKLYPDPGNLNSEDDIRQQRYREKLRAMDKDVDPSDPDYPYKVAKQIFNFSLPLHEYSISQITTLETIGILDLIKEDYIKNNKINPAEYRYINYLGSKKIDYITSRSAAQWDIIYIPHVDYLVLNKFKELYVINRDIYLRRTNQLAYTNNSDYYEQMMMFVIVCQTFNDMVVDTPEWYIRRDIIDLRSVQYFLESNGVQFFADIPLRYQKRIVKNLNQLIKYKSTTQNILDILAIFNSENTIIYKYYLMRKNAGAEYDPEIEPDDPELVEWRRLTELDCGCEEEFVDVISTGDGQGNDRTFIPENDICPVPVYEFNREEEDSPVFIWDFHNRLDYGPNEEYDEEEYYIPEDGKPRDEYGNVYNLDFVKVPIDKELDDYIRDSDNYESYNEITYQDKYWDGEDSHNLVRNNHCAKDFLIEGTKYMGLEFEVFIEQYQYQREYYLGLIFDGGVDIEDLKIAVPEIKPDTLFNIRDLLIFLYCCNGLYANDDIKINNPLEAMSERTEPQPEFQPYHDYDGGTYQYATPYIEQDGHHPGDQLPNFHEYILGGDTKYSSNITQDTFYDYIRTDHQDLFIDLFGRIYGFNMNADLDEVAQRIGFKHSKFGFERGYTLEELGVDTFITGRKVHTIQELYDIYENNTKCYKKLRSWFQNASNRDERRVYDYVYYELFTTPYNQDFYMMPDGTMAQTYDQVLMKYDYTLYTIYLELKAEQDLDARRALLNDIVNSIIDTLNYYMNGDNLQYILTFVDNNTIDALVHYISEMINFFKSWKTYFLEPKTNFIIGDSGMIDEDGHRLSGSSSPEYIVTYGDQVGVYTERFWTVENGRLADSVVVRNFYIIEDQLNDNINYNAEVVDIAGHYVDNDPLGDKYFDGQFVQPSPYQQKVLDAGSVDEDSYSPYYVYNGGNVASRRYTHDIEGGQEMDTLDRHEIDGGDISDVERMYTPINSPADADVEKYFCVNGGWVTARQITDKTTEVTVDEGYCENYKETRPQDEIPYSRNRISIKARVADFPSNGIEVTDNGLLVSDIYAKSSELEEEFINSTEFKNQTIQELEYNIRTLHAYTSLEELSLFINQLFAQKFAGATNVINKLSDPNYDDQLVADGKAKVDNFEDWWSQNNPFTWKDFEEDLATN